MKLFELKKLLFLLPKWVRFKIFNIKTLKLYKTSTGSYYLPFFAFRDVVRNTIISNQIFDQDVYECSKKYIKENSVVIDAGANYGQMSILFSKVKPNVMYILLKLINIFVTSYQKILKLMTQM